MEWVAISFSRGSSQPRDRTWVSYALGEFFTDWAISPELVLFACSSAWALLPHKERCPPKLNWEVEVLELTFPTFEGLIFATLFQL